MPRPRRTAGCAWPTSIVGRAPPATRRVTTLLETSLGAHDAPIRAPSASAGCLNSASAGCLNGANAVVFKRPNAIRGVGCPAPSKAGSRSEVGTRAPADNTRCQGSDQPTSLRHCSGICSSLARAIALSLVLLGMAWIVVEFALVRPAVRRGLSGDGQTESTHLYWVARSLPYGMVALLVGLATVSLLAATSEARLALPSKTRSRRLPNSDTRPSLRTSFCVNLVPPCEAYPRAPPV